MEKVERKELGDDAAIVEVLVDTFGLGVSPDDIRSALDALARAGRRGASHAIFS
jgi:hypothetical protein